MTVTVKTKTKRRAAFFLASLFLLLMFFKNATVAASAIADGLRLCATTLIPSLFPLMVASELLVLSGAVERLGRFLSRPCRTLFGLSGDAFCAVLLGMLCGFPIGTRCAVSLYRDGRINEEDLSRVLAFSNHPSSAFLLSTVGLSLFGSFRIGLLLYLSTLLSSLLLQIFFHLLRWDKRKKAGTRKARTLPPLSSEPPSFASALSAAVSSSALSLLSICAFVIFFSALVESLTHLCAGLSLSPAATALLFGIFELTGGVSHAALCPARIAPYLCAFSVGWAGLSVHFQLLYLTSDTSFSKSKYFFTKLAQGALNIPIFALLLWTFGKT